MTERWRLRPSRQDDLCALHAVWRASVEATHDFLDPADLETISEQVRTEYLPTASLLVAADGEDRPIAFMGMTGGEIDTLFIDPAWRRRGLGRAFVEAAIAACQGDLEVAVNAQNTAGVDFYRALDFSAFALSPEDDRGRPDPILRMRRPAR